MSRTHHVTPGAGRPVGRLELDPQQLRRAGRRLEQTAEEYDATGGSVPPPGTGMAAPLVALALGAHLEAASVVVSECRVLALAIAQVSADLEITDAQSALDLYDLRTAS